MLIITVPELLDKVNGLNLPILLFCHQKNSNLSVVTFTGLVDKAGCKGVILLCLWHIGSGAAPFGKELMENCAKSSPLAVVAQ
ncbi:hypothetical protein K7X08_005615 [Anisodus acutangulus]|uniref:Uncharacterized protein n=1 Tax=Anisodus acutangulus TaxID=402998 RepID=A0A9Q1R6I7_9SOLA|nr:hypothetical protein K7X08_005615 [Anisodus acutangulus]